MATRTSGRIVVPGSPVDLLKLSKAIYTKHLADGAASPLKVMVDYDWALEGPKIDPCLKDHNDAEEFSRKAEKAYASRDLNLKPIKEIVKNSAAVLKSLYAKNPKKLGEWGIVVDDSPQTKKTSKAK